LNDPADVWFRQSTSSVEVWPIERVLQAKRESGETISVVIPARDEAATISVIVKRIMAELVDATGLVDEVIVMDSDSEDDTGRIARAAGATVHRTDSVAPELGSFPGKGEALWKAQFVTEGTTLVFVDGDLTVWSPDFVVGLLGPLLTRGETLLVKGFYRRLSGTDGSGPEDGGRVTELVARPLINLWWPALAAVVQPLAGEWAIRRSLLETLRVPTGYGVELAVLLDTYEGLGLDALAQVDLGSRGHQRQSVRDLGLMAAELMSVAYRRGAKLAGGPAATPSPVLRQYDVASGWIRRPVPSDERPPAISLPAYERHARRTVGSC
jgi:Glycosyltransferases, probably involved in cell wall biogenesis